MTEDVKYQTKKSKEQVSRSDQSSSSAPFAVSSMGTLTGQISGCNQQSCQQAAFFLCNLSLNTIDLLSSSPELD